MPPPAARTFRLYTPAASLTLVAGAAIAAALRMWTEPSPTQTADMTANATRIAALELTTSLTSQKIAGIEKDVSGLRNDIVKLDAQQRADQTAVMKMLIDLQVAMGRVETEIKGKLTAK